MTETVSNKKSEVEQIREEFERSKDTHIWKDYVNALRLVAQVVFTRSSGFVLEFIQNAEDAGHGSGGKGEVHVFVNRERLKFVHNGRPFDQANLRAICGIQSSKKPERGTLGYLGIGFKSAFKVADRIEVYSNGFQFKFDRNHEGWMGQASETPWHVIPIWVEEPSELVEAEKTTFIVRLRNEDAYQHLMTGLKEIRAELYLFLKWIKRIEITDEVSGETWSLEDLGEAPDGITSLTQNGIVHRFKFFRREVEVPDTVKPDRLTQEYRANVTKREIAIAFAVDEKGNLDPSPATAMYGGVYSFLPLGESKSGAKFPIQADFLVQPGRDSVNAEALWNHWLVGEVAELCKEALGFFQKHDVWKYQFLAAFEFTRSKGYEAHDKLFGPKLIEPIEKFLNENPCALTVDDKWARLSEVVLLTENAQAAKGLVEMGVLAGDEIAPVLGGSPGLQLLHAKVAQGQSHRFKKVDRWVLFENEEFLEMKAASNDAATWFRSLYRWLHTYPSYEEYFHYKPRKRIKRYDGKEIVLTADKHAVAGAGVWLLELASTDPFITKLAFELQQTKPMLHPDILAQAKDDSERESLKAFLTGLVGVQKMDAKAVCEEAILPKIVGSAPQPVSAELLDYTKYCEQYLPAGVVRGREFWVVTKSGSVRRAKEVLFSTEFKPVQNWEINQQYVKGLDFLSPAYVAACTADEELKAWRELLKAGGVKEEPDNGVYEFATNFAKQKLAVRFKNVVNVDKRNFGYDLEAEDEAGQKVQIEVKGQAAEADVELTGNEAQAADKYRDSFYLCVVSSIPDSPTIHLVRNPALVGKKDKLTVPKADWKAGRVLPASP